MPAVSNAATNDRDIAYYPLSLEEDMEPKFFEKDKGASVRLKYGIWFGIDQEDISGEEGIQRRELLAQFDARVQWKTSRAFYTLSSRTESPITDVGLERIDKNTLLDFQRCQILEQFDVIAQREDNWDEYESKKPNKLSLNRAKHFMEEFLDTVVSEGHSWLTPLISSDEDGYITVEWYGDARQLHLQIEANAVVYIQVWGPNIETEMNVDVLHRKDYLTIWKWLLYG